MEDTTKIALAAAVAGGYILGRTKKGRLAFSIATYLAGRRFGLEPGQLLKEGASRLKEMPQFADLTEQLRGEALDAGRQALATAANRKLTDLAGALHERTLELSRSDTDRGREDDGEEEQDEDQEPYEDEEAEGYAEEDDDYAPEDEDEEEEGPEPTDDEEEPDEEEPEEEEPEEEESLPR
ncbi:histone protein, partial [Streptomyces sp. NPDC056492]